MGSRVCTSYWVYIKGKLIDSPAEEWRSDQSNRVADGINLRRRVLQPVLAS